MSDDGNGDGHIAGATMALLIRVVERIAGDAGVEQMFRLAGEQRTRAEVEDLASWSTYEAAVRLMEAGITATGERLLGRMVGEETLLQYHGTEVAALIRSLGSPAGVLRQVAATATKFSTATALDAIDVTDGSAVIVARGVHERRRHQVMCEYTAGMLSQAPVLFGLDPADVVEATCQCRGDDQCTYVVRWEDRSELDIDPSRRMAELEQQVDTLSQRFESVLATAAELVAADDVDEVLRAIVQRAGLAVRATRYALAVRLTPEGPLRIDHRGYNEEPPGWLIAELLSETPALPPSCLVVDVATSRRRFGRLVAVGPEGSRFLPGEHRFLEAYAANAAVALKAAAALDDARRGQETATALLQLATAVAQVGSPEEMAQRIAESVPVVVGGEAATVLLWHEDDRELRFAGFTGLAEQAVSTLRDLALTPSDTPALAAMLEGSSHIFIDENTEDPYLQGLLEVGQVEAAVVVSMVAGDRFLGVVAAELAANTDEARHDLLERLAGLAAQGATALENGRLVEELREQSLHDALTGLPNRRLLRDRIEHALEQGHRTDRWPVLVFLDLDHFKAINDTYGHAAGDDVVSVVADRLRRTVRASDTVARIGGDEFAVLLEGLARSAEDATRMSEVLLEQIRQPIAASGHELHLSASVGSTAATADDDHDALLRRADLAMYEAKAAGRDAAVFR